MASIDGCQLHREYQGQDEEEYTSFTDEKSCYHKENASSKEYSNLILRGEFMCLCFECTEENIKYFYQNKPFGEQ